MTGYTAFGRVERRRVHEPAPSSRPGTSGMVVESARIDAWASPTIAWFDGLAPRLARLRETWTMTTFYLFDPDSWR